MASSVSGPIVDGVAVVPMALCQLRAFLHAVTALAARHTPSSANDTNHTADSSLSSAAGYAGFTGTGAADPLAPAAVPKRVGARLGGHAEFGGGDAIATSSFSSFSRSTRTSTVTGAGAGAGAGVRAAAAAGVGGAAAVPHPPVPRAAPWPLAGSSIVNADGLQAHEPVALGSNLEGASSRVARSPKSVDNQETTRRWPETANAKAVRDAGDRSHQNEYATGPGNGHESERGCTSSTAFESQAMLAARDGASGATNAGSGAPSPLEIIAGATARVQAAARATGPRLTPVSHAVGTFDADGAAAAATGTRIIAAIAPAYAVALAIGMDHAAAWLLRLHQGLWAAPAEAAGTPAQAIAEQLHAWTATLLEIWWLVRAYFIHRRWQSHRRTTAAMTGSMAATSSMESPPAVGSIEAATKLGIGVLTLLGTLGHEATLASALAAPGNKGIARRVHAALVSAVVVSPQEVPAEPGLPDPHVRHADGLAPLPQPVRSTAFSMLSCFDAISPHSKGRIGAVLRPVLVGLSHAAPQEFCSGGEPAASDGTGGAHVAVRALKCAEVTSEYKSVLIRESLCLLDRLARKAGLQRMRSLSTTYCSRHPDADDDADALQSQWPALVMKLMLRSPAARGILFAPPPGSQSGSCMLGVLLPCMATADGRVPAVLSRFVMKLAAPGSPVYWSILLHLCAPSEHDQLTGLAMWSAAVQLCSAGGSEPIAVEEVSRSPVACAAGNWPGSCTLAICEAATELNAQLCNMLQSSFSAAGISASAAKPWLAFYANACAIAAASCYARVRAAALLTWRSAVDGIIHYLESPLVAAEPAAASEMPAPDGREGLASLDLRSCRVVSLLRLCAQPMTIGARTSHAPATADVNGEADSRCERSPLLMEDKSVLVAAYATWVYAIQTLATARLAHLPSSAHLFSALSDDFLPKLLRSETADYGHARSSPSRLFLAVVTFLTELLLPCRAGEAGRDAGAAATPPATVFQAHLPLLGEPDARPGARADDFWREHMAGVSRRHTTLAELHTPFHAAVPVFLACIDVLLSASDNAATAEASSDPASTWLVAPAGARAARAAAFYLWLVVWIRIAGLPGEEYVAAKRSALGCMARQPAVASRQALHQISRLAFNVSIAASGHARAGTSPVGSDADAALGDPDKALLIAAVHAFFNEPTLDAERSRVLLQLEPLSPAGTYLCATVLGDLHGGEAASARGGHELGMGATDDNSAGERPAKRRTPNHDSGVGDELPGAVRAAAWAPSASPVPPSGLPQASTPAPASSVHSSAANMTAAGTPAALAITPPRTSPSDVGAITHPLAGPPAFATVAAGIAPAAPDRVLQLMQILNTMSETERAILRDALSRGMVE